MEFNIGDRVKAIADDPKGFAGIVIPGEDSGPDSILVKFDKWDGGHGDGLHEWYMAPDELQLIQDTLLPANAAERKKIPVGTGVLDYFPAALAEVAKVSYNGNQQHNPGQPLHWARGKSADHADTLQRHFLERGTLDSDGQRHSAKMAWRALAILQLELEAEGAPISRGSK